ncbi:Hypothetical protein I5071_7860 [Sandaracinus amylolyticus]|nr:Hypothetical protein I5071_7860 [Sandaracinus amylolyticus]
MIRFLVVAFVLIDLALKLRMRRWPTRRHRGTVR